MASGEEIAMLSDSELKSEETSETEAIGIGCSTSSGKLRSDVWNYFSKCTATVGKGYSPIRVLKLLTLKGIGIQAIKSCESSYCLDPYFLLKLIILFLIEFTLSVHN